MPASFVTEPTLISSFIGGTLIGCAAVLLMAVHGRIAGITGILSGLLPPSPASNWKWRLAFLAGLVAAPLLYTGILGLKVEMVVPSSTPMLLASGLIVGFGVTFGSGCTSGHGVCGLARFSPRSIAATLTFMTTAAITVYLIRHVFGG